MMEILFRIRKEKVFVAEGNTGCDATGQMRREISGNISLFT